jgi:proteasome lid subunit RPN8/RPN11
VLVTGLDTRAIDSKDLPKEKSPAVRQGFRVFVSEEAFDRATTRGQADLSREVGGILVGRLYQDEAGPFLKVDTTIDALHAEEKGTELTFTHATWEHIHKEMDSKHKGKRIVGWYHTHPGFGIFLSDRDLFIHQSFFNLPYQVALVYDPKSHAHGVFVWHENEPARARRYWVGKEENLWDGARTSAASASSAKTDSEKAAGSAGTVKTATNDKPDPEPGWDWLSVGALGLAVLLFGAVVGYWGGQFAMRDTIEQAKTQIERAQFAAAQELLRVLNPELLSFVRQAAGGDTLRVPLEESIADLDEGLTKLGRGEEMSAALARLTEGRRKLVALRDAHLRADRALQTLERIGEVSTVSPREVSRMLSDQRAALGQLYAEVAEDVAKAGDKSRARRLLELASKLDSGNARRYEERRRALGAGESP